MSILQQTTFPPIQGVPHLPAHQQQTKATAVSWRSVVRPAVFLSNDANIAFDDRFNAIYERLHSIAPRVLIDRDARQLFTTSLHELTNEISRLKNLTINAASKLKTFLLTMSSHSVDLHDDVPHLDDAINESNGKKQTLTRFIAQLEHRIQYYENDVKITTETVTETSFFFFRISRVVARDTSESRRMLNRLIHDRHQVYTLLASIENSIAMADNVKSEITLLLGDYVKNVLNATEALCSDWSQLEIHYGLVDDKLSYVSATPQRDNMRTRTFGIILQKQLQAGKKEWEDLFNYAKRIRGSPSALPVSHVV
jgi:hypothetical protein